MNSKIRGGCACRAVRYEIAGDPQFQCQCQCSTCQRITGTGHSDALGFSEGAVSIAGTLSFYRLPATAANLLAAASARNAARRYCGNSRLFPALYSLRPAAWTTQACSSPKQCCTLRQDTHGITWILNCRSLRNCGRATSRTGRLNATTRRGKNRRHPPSLAAVAKKLWITSRISLFHFKFSLLKRFATASCNP